MKIAFISPSLCQGGSQRFVYEHAVELKKKGHECVVITKQTKQGYYVDKLEGHGIPVIGGLGWRLELSKIGSYKVTQVMRFIFSLLDYYRLRPDKYDVILINQIETYHSIRSYPPMVKNAIVLLMSHKFQYPFDIYNGINESIKAYLIDEKQKAELEESRINFDYIQYPLSINITAYKPAIYANGTERLAYFARLSGERPIEPVFFALFLLKKIRPNVVLHIFGSGELSFEQARLFNILGLIKNVVFEGHALCMKDSIRDKQICVVWATCAGNTVGYSSIELMAHRVPLLLWNLDLSILPNILPAHSSFEDFVKNTIKALDDSEYADVIVKDNYNYISNNCDISKNSNLLLSFSENKSPSF